MKTVKATRAAAIILTLILAVILLVPVVMPGGKRASGVQVSPMGYDYETDCQEKVSRLPVKDLQFLYVLSNISDEPIKVRVNYSSPYVPEFNPYLSEAGDYVHAILFYDMPIADALELPSSKSSTGTIAEHGSSSGNLGIRPGSENLQTFYKYHGDMLWTSDINLFNIQKKGYRATAYLSNLNFTFNTHFGDRTDVRNEHFMECWRIKSYSEPYVDGDEIICDDRYASTRYIYFAYEEYVEKFDVEFIYRDVQGTERYEYKQFPIGTILTNEDIPVIPRDIPYGHFVAWDIKRFTDRADLIYTAQYNIELFNVVFYDHIGSLANASKYRVSYYDSLSQFVGTVEPDYKDGNDTYYFKGWSTEKDNKKKIVDITTYRVTADTNFYPIYTKRFRVPFFSQLAESWAVLGAWQWHLGSEVLPIGKFFQGAIIVALVVLVAVIIAAIVKNRKGKGGNKA